MRKTSAAPLLAMGMALLLTACPSPSTPDPARSSVTVDRPIDVVADGLDFAVIRVTVRDAAGKPVSGQLVTLSVTGQQNAVSSPARTDGDGVTTASLSSRVAETKTITATLAGGDLPEHPTVAFRAGPPSALKSTVSAQPASAVADGLASVAIDIVLRDANDNLVPGVQVQLTATGAETVLVQPGPTDLSGVTSGALSSSRAETKRVTAVATPSGGAAVTLLQQPLVEFVSGSVTCAQTVHYVTRTGVVDRVADLSDAPIGAYALGADGGYTYYPGTADGGTCLIPDVPQGRFLFRYGFDYVDTSARFIDLSLSREGRPDRVRADAGTGLDVALSNLAPATRRDYLLAHSFDTEYYFPILGAGAPEGSTAGLTSFSWDGAPLLDAAKGDAVTFTQLSARNPPEFPTADGGIGPRFYRAATRFHQASVTLQDGTTSSLDAGFATVAPQPATTLGWKLSPSTPGSFWSFTSQVNPTAGPFSISLYVGPLVDGSRGFYGITPRILWLSWSLLGTEPDTSITASWGNPFPPQYEVSARAYGFFEVAHDVPMTGGGTATVFTDVSINVLDRLSSFPLASIQPAISPVTAPLVNGTSFFADRSGVGTAPVVSWSPPAVGTPTHYLVDIGEVDPAAVPFSPRSFASVQTALTQVKLPPILTPGRYYVLTVTAYHQPGHDTERLPWETTWPAHSAPAVSGLLSP